MSAKPQWEKVKQKARELLSSAQKANPTLAQPPIRVEQIAREVLGINIIKAPLDDDLSGFLYLQGDSAIIGVNKKHHVHRRRFTVAHELGHLLLHREGTKKEGAFIDKTPLVLRRDPLSSAGVDPLEVEANAFAAELLMPRELVEEDFNRLLENPLLGEEEIVKNLAKKYKVSEQAMAIRLSQLGYIGGFY